MGQFLIMVSMLIVVWGVLMTALGTTNILQICVHEYGERYHNWVLIIKL